MLLYDVVRNQRWSLGLPPSSKFLFVIISVAGRCVWFYLYVAYVLRSVMTPNCNARPLFYAFPLYFSLFFCYYVMLPSEGAFVRKIWTRPKPENCLVLRR